MNRSGAEANIQTRKVGHVRGIFLCRGRNRAFGSIRVGQQAKVVQNKKKPQDQVHDEPEDYRHGTPGEPFAPYDFLAHKVWTHALACRSALYLNVRLNGLSTGLMPGDLTSIWRTHAGFDGVSTL